MGKNDLQVNAQIAAKKVQYTQFIMTLATTAAAEILKEDYQFSDEMLKDFAVKMVRRTREKSEKHKVG